MSQRRRVRTILLVLSVLSSVVGQALFATEARADCVYAYVYLTNPATGAEVCT